MENTEKKNTPESQLDWLEKINAVMCSFAKRDIYIDIHGPTYNYSWRMGNRNFLYAFSITHIENYFDDKYKKHHKKPHTSECKYNSYGDALKGAIEYIEQNYT